MFSPVWLAARLSFMSPQAAPPGLRKSFWRSVITSAVRGRSIAMPGIGNAIVPPFPEVPKPVVTGCGRENDSDQEVGLPAHRRGASTRETSPGGDQLLQAVVPPGRPRLAEEPVIHAGEVALPLAELAAEQRHALHGAGVLQPPGVQEAERHPLGQGQEPAV